MPKRSVSRGVEPARRSHAGKRLWETGEEEKNLWTQLGVALFGVFLRRMPWMPLWVRRSLTALVTDTLDSWAHRRLFPRGELRIFGFDISLPLRLSWVPWRGGYSPVRGAEQVHVGRKEDCVRIFFLDNDNFTLREKLEIHLTQETCSGGWVFNAKSDYSACAFICLAAELTIDAQAEKCFRCSDKVRDNGVLCRRHWFRHNDETNACCNLMTDLRLLTAELATIYDNCISYREKHILRSSTTF